MDSDFRTRRGRLRGFSINRLIPNVLTLAALCSGLTAIRFGLQGELKLAVIAIIVAAVLDALDGRVARRLGVPSRFGTVLVAVGGLMVSRVPTFSFKKGRVPRHLVLPTLLGAALVMGVIASSPWIGLSLLGLVYVSLIPYSWMAYRRQAVQNRDGAGVAEVVNLRAVDSGSPPRE